MAAIDQQPAPIVAPLVDGDMKTVITSSSWRTFFQSLAGTVGSITNRVVVDSFNGRTGPVVSQVGDYSVNMIPGAVSTSRTINGHPLSSNIVLTNADVGGIPEAPTDGRVYVRRNGAWVVGLDDPPHDGQVYVRRNGAWEVLTIT
jgi:hypothetical protein